MADVLAGLPVGNMGLGGLVTLFFVLFFTGKIVTRQAVVDKEAEVARLWAANQDSAEANKVLTNTVAKLTAHIEGIDRSFRELQLEATRTAALTAALEAEDATRIAGEKA